MALVSAEEQTCWVGAEAEEVLLVQVLAEALTKKQRNLHQLQASLLQHG
tara:strand:- start:903 stop:1049 length:147 start_codon:yes stop_codon:yes gene_type:complete